MAGSPLAITNEEIHVIGCGHSHGWWGLISLGFSNPRSVQQLKNKKS
jgi:hypothetical protein